MILPFLQQAWQQWLRFWFTAADPTTLGFMRVVTGSLALYVHLAYSFDLQAFFGEHGWYGLKYVNRERHEFPHVVQPFWSWDDSAQRSAFVPEYPHRRKPVVDWMTKLIEKYPTTSELNKALEYLDFAQQTARPMMNRLPQVAQNALDYLSGLSPDPKDRAVQLTVLVDESKHKEVEESRVPRLFVPRTPDFVLALSDDDRKQLPSIVERFYSTLPMVPTERGFVLAHLYEMDLQSRDATIRFLKELVTLDEKERNRRLDYLVYWNTEERITHHTGLPIFSLWYHVTDPTAMAIVHTGVLLIFVLFTIGYQTRVTSALAWFAAVSYIHRTQQILFGMDTMMNILLFYLMVGDSGAALSVDRLLKRYRAIRLALQKHGQIDTATLAYLQAPPPSVSCGFAQRLIQVHFCFIYFAAGCSKFKGATWWNNNAYWDTLVNPEFTMIHFQWYEQLVRQAVSIRPIYGFLAAGGVIFTFMAELGLPFLVWTRLRPYVVIMGFLLHAGVAVFMGLWIFSLLMMTLLLAYLPGAMFRARFFNKAPDADKLKIQFNPTVDAQAHAAALAKTFDTEEAVQLEKTAGPLQVVVASSSQPEADSAKSLLHRVKGLRWLGYVALVPVLGNWITKQFKG